MTSAVKSATRQWSNIRARCAFRECHHTQITRWIPGGHPGIVAGDSWYCSIDCFALAARTPLELLSNRHVVEIQRQPRLPLSLLLVSKGFLTPEQMRQATTQSQNSSEELEAVLVRMGYVTENQLAAARSAQWGYPVLSSDFVGLWVETDVPVGLLKAFRAVPLHYSASANRLLGRNGASIDAIVDNLHVASRTLRDDTPGLLSDFSHLSDQVERITTPFSDRSAVMAERLDRITDSADRLTSSLNDHPELIEHLNETLTQLPPLLKTVPSTLDRLPGERGVLRARELLTALRRG